jgi:hypothetical protein
MTCRPDPLPEPVYVTDGNVPTSAQKLFWNSEIQFVWALFWKDAPRPEIAVP